tara:strand:- start:942 stop:1283 length:342 start_codon:yes stop_codon:yes gene_type:complete
MIKICFDLDGVICNTKNNNYKKSKPIKKSIRYINDLYNNNYKIVIFTARYMGRNKDKVTYAKQQGLNSTKKQLKNWGVKYHKLIFGKPSYDFIVDDKALGFKKNWIIDLKKKL